MPKTIHQISIIIVFNKRMLFSYILTMFFCFTGHSQIQKNDFKLIKSEVYQSLHQMEIVKLKNYDFQENFAVLLRSDKSSNYYFIDTSKLLSPFAFKYFIYLVCQSGYRIQTGHGMRDNTAWFITDNKISEIETLKQILSFKQNANDKDRILSPKEKEDWIKLNNY